MSVLPDFPLTTAYGRVRRFAFGDRVKVVHPGPTIRYGLRVFEWAADLHPAGYEHCSGKSARYRLSDTPGWTYDWQLERDGLSFEEWMLSVLRWLHLL